MPTPSKPPTQRSLRLAAVGTAVLAAAVAGLPGLTGSTGTAAAAVETCPTGYVHELSTDLAAFADGSRGTCVRSVHPEGLRETLAANSQLASRASAPFATVADGAVAAGAAQRNLIAAASAEGARLGAWAPLGTTPLITNEPGFDQAEGLGDVAGRVEDLVYDTRDARHVFGAVATGGVWESPNSGGTWRSIGDKLPTQTAGALVFTRASGGTLILGTGDPSYGGTGISGLGAYWTKDFGVHWVRSGGVPSDNLTFAGAVDPHNPMIVYLATSKGLYRSVNAGRSFVNVGLPTTCTDIGRPTCFFANMVTDVVVNAKGNVLAAVGWRAGTAKNAQGQPQSPRNGLYTSATGAPRSFAFLSSPVGFTPQAAIGRVALGSAHGAGQDSNYVFAVVQDANKFNNIATTFGVPEPDQLPAKAPKFSVLDGIYGSADFGVSWTKLADQSALLSPASGTALTGIALASYQPGVQAWYNEWISVDPTTTGPVGNPTRIAFGLEEVWENDSPIVIVPAAVTGAVGPLGPGLSQVPIAGPGTTAMKVIGQYFAGDACAMLNLGLPTCPFRRGLGRGTTHPDQHAGMFVPTGEGGVTLYAGNDGGVYKQTVVKGADFDNSGWGTGANIGFQTLLPYDVAIAKDGTAYIGMQDNGTGRITPSGRQIAIYGGDGFFVATDPDNSAIAWEEYTAGDIRVTTNAGAIWTSNKPTMTAALFATPFVMDRTDADHLVIGGRQVFETLSGPRTKSASWRKVFDLGTRTRPGQSAAGSAAGDPENSLSATDTRGNATYVGFCGYCDVVTQGVPFARGIATNVGRGGHGAAGSTANWHVANAIGLPVRYVTSITIDPRDVKTVYATLGGYGRRWIPPGSLGDNVSKIGRGHVFVSHDAGDHFTDISGNLPDVPANDTVLHRGDLVVATDVGVFVANGTNGGRYQLLGTGLPSVPVFQVNASPRSIDEFVAASYGRGAYRIALAGHTLSGQSSVGTSGDSSKGKGTSNPGTTFPGSSANPEPTAETTSIGWVAAIAGMVALLAVGALVLRRRTEEDEIF